MTDDGVVKVMEKRTSSENSSTIALLSRKQSHPDVVF